MTTAQLLIVCITVLSLMLMGVVLALWPARRRLAPTRVSHRVNVHTKHPDYHLISGVMVGDYQDRVVLVDAEYVTADSVMPLSAPQHIEMRDVSRIEVLGLVAPARSATPTTDGAGLPEVGA